MLLLWSELLLMAFFAWSISPMSPFISLWAFSEKDFAPVWMSLYFDCSSCSGSICASMSESIFWSFWRLCFPRRWGEMSDSSAALFSS